MRAIELALVQALWVVSLARATAQPTPEVLLELESKIALTPAQPIDLANAASVAAAGQVSSPVPGTVLPASTKIKPGEARFVALSHDDDDRLAAFAMNAPQTPMRVFRGAIRTLAADEQAVTLKAVAIAQGPLRFNPKSDLFEGRVSVGLVSLTPNVPTKLAAPVVFQVLGGVSARPPSLKVDHIAPPYDDIEVMTKAPTRPVEVKLVSGVTPEGVSLSLAAAPAIRVRAKPAQIQGWGIEVADLSVEILGPRNGVASQLRLSSTRGPLTDRVLAIPSGVGSTKLRSQGTGLAAVSVSGPGLAEGKLEIEFAIPWHFMLAALVGGLLGAFIRQLWGTRWRDLIVAVLVAALAATLYVQGVNAFGLAFSATTSEIVTFVVAALGAYGGADLLERFVRWRARVA